MQEVSEETYSAEETKKASEELENLYNSLLIVNMNDLEGFVEDKEKFDEMYADYLLKYDPILITDSSTKSIIYDTLSRVSAEGIKRLNYTEEKIRDTIEERKMRKEKIQQNIGGKRL